MSVKYIRIILHPNIQQKLKIIVYYFLFDCKNIENNVDYENILLFIFNYNIKNSLFNHINKYIFN